MLWRGARRPCRHVVWQRRISPVRTDPQRKLYRCRLRRLRHFWRDHGGLLLCHLLGLGTLCVAKSSLKGGLKGSPTRLFGTVMGLRRGWSAVASGNICLLGRRRNGSDRRCHSKLWSFDGFAGVGFWLFRRLLSFIFFLSFLLFCLGSSVLEPILSLVSDEHSARWRWISLTPTR